MKNSRTDGVSHGTRSTRAKMTPIRKHPIMLAKKVPQLNPVPNRRIAPSDTR